MPYGTCTITFLLLNAVGMADLVTPDFNPDAYKKEPWLWHLHYHLSTSNAVGMADLVTPDFNPDTYKKEPCPMPLALSLIYF